MKRASLTNPSAEGQMDRAEKLVNFQHPADLGKCRECPSMYNNVPNRLRGNLKKWNFGLFSIIKNLFSL